MTSVAHANSVTETRRYTPYAYAGLEEIQVSGMTGASDWTFGPFAFDALGNVSAIGAASFVYDTFGRLTSGEVDTEIARVGIVSQSLAYDPFGNITRIDDPTGVRDLTVDPLTNRLGSQHADYDPAGNLTRMAVGAHDYVHAFDPLNRVLRRQGPGLETRHLYTAAGERIGTYDAAAQTWTWTPRDPENRVLSRFTTSADGTWAWKKDYVHAEGRSLATVQLDPATGAENTRHLHLDHLGSVRWVTDPHGAPIGELTSYLPLWRLRPRRQPRRRLRGAAVHQPRARRCRQRQRHPRLHARPLLQRTCGSLSVSRSGSR